MAERVTFSFCPLCAGRLDPHGGAGGRPACPACDYVQYPDPKVAAGGVFELDGGILLVRRNHDPMYGRWSFPSGYVDAGEVVEEAAVREVLEETAVEVRIDRLLGSTAERRARSSSSPSPERRPAASRVRARRR